MQNYLVKHPVTGEQMYNADKRPVIMNCPPTREEALRDGYEKFYTHEVCPAHAHHGALVSVVYVKSGVYGCCVHENATREHWAAVQRGEPENTTDAAARGLDYYWTPMAFTKCGHPGKTTFKGTCYECAEARTNSPRQVALREGLAWYQPTQDDPCPHGHIAPRRVTNGSCKQCEEDRKPAVPEPIYKQFPDMKISYEDAVTLGFVAYNSGKPCKYGHPGWRYVSTRTCVTCMGREL